MKEFGKMEQVAVSSVAAVNEQSYRDQRICRDLYHRALIGPVFYVLAYLTVLAIMMNYRPWSWPLALPIIAYCVLWWLRYQHRPLPPEASEKQYQRWFRFQWTLILFGTALWGAIAAAIPYLERKPNIAVLVAMIVTIAICTAASQTFSMHPLQSRICMVVILLPSVIVCAFPQVNLFAVSVTLLIYSAYLFLNLQKFAQEYGQQIELEIELMSSRAELAKMSMMDGLTGLQNRLSYEQIWPRTWHLAARKQEPLALMMLDLDHFKAINDQHGHLIGDACLRHFASVLQRYARRDSDFIARIGGEEFIMVLPATALNVAHYMAEQLRIGLESAPCMPDQLNIPMTVSIGVGIVDWSKDQDHSISFNRIDHACYLAKHAGRNCVVVA